jgi:hypothetical protein
MDLNHTIDLISRLFKNKTQLIQILLSCIREHVKLTIKIIHSAEKRDEGKNVRVCELWWRLMRFAISRAARFDSYSRQRL